MLREDFGNVLQLRRNVLKKRCEEGKMPNERKSVDYAKWHGCALEGNGKRVTASETGREYRVIEEIHA